ncbi:MAG: SCP-like extracellular [Erythrobacter sp.]|nr:MAG: SCP-like extracellular [Erythrobacter sp.]
MGKGRVLAICALAAAAATPLLAQDGEGINPFAMRLLQEHNHARDDVGVPRLAWSNRLASEAQDWAEELARRGRMEHSTQEGRRGAGENLWMGSAGYYGPEVMIGAFVDERRMFRGGTFPQVSTTGRWNDVGHYTQVVWRETQEVGCAVARGGGNDFLVCRYWPAGNVYDRQVF